MATAADLRPVKPGIDNSFPAECTIDPEFDLLLSCCRQPQAVFLDERIEQLLVRCDWTRFAGLVKHHHVVPQVYRCLVSRFQQVPARAFNELQLLYEQNVRRALWFTAELVRILKHLEERGIKAVPYKGPLLAQTLYGDVAARQFGDLDILVCPQDAIKTKVAFSELGYQPTFALSERVEREHVASGHGYAFDGEAGPHLVEVQWRVLPHFYAVDFDLPRLLDRAETISLSGRPVNTLSPEDLLLVLCAHAAKHVWAQLAWLCDIAELAKSPGIDWRMVWARAHKLGIQRIIAVNLVLAENFLGSDMPARVRQFVDTDRTSAVLASKTAEIIEHSASVNTESGSYFRMMMRLRERRLDKGRFLWRLFWTPSFGEWSAMRLPEPLFPLYRGVRLWRLGVRLASLVRARG